MSQFQVILSIIMTIIVGSLFVILLIAPEVIVESQTASIFLPALFVLIIFLFVSIERGILRGRIYGPDRAFSEHNPSVIVRAIYDQISGEQCLVRGTSATTYREAVEKYWAFTHIPMDADWRIINEAGNDISNNPLDSYEGHAYITICDSDSM